MIAIDRFVNRTFLTLFLYSSVFCLAGMLATIQNEEQTVIEKKIEIQKASMQIHIATAWNLYQQGGFASLQHWLIETEKEYPNRFYLFDAEKKDLLKRTPPIDIDELWPLLQTQQVFIEPLDKNGIIMGQKLVSADKPPFFLAGLLFSQYTPSFWERRNSFFWKSIVGCLILSTLFSALIAWYLNATLNQLKEFTRQLIEGDLSSRPPKWLQKRKDDTGEVARDFDRLAHQLQESYEAQQSLLKEISRELRSPLARMQVAVELAQQQADHTIARALTRIEFEGKRLGSLIDQLLKIPEISGVHRQPLKEKLDLLQVIDQTIEEANFAAHQHSIKIEIITPLKKATVSTRNNLLKNALTHIIQNALEHTPKQSTITVSLQEEKASNYQTFYVLRVKDEGQGVPERYLSQIFTSFFRVDDSRNQGNHTGLGLAIAKSAIEQHGGSIFAENTKPGLMITMRIPATAASNMEKINLQ